MPTDRPKYPDGAVVMDEHVTAEYVAELSARIAELEAEVARLRARVDEVMRAMAGEAMSPSARERPDEH